MMVKYSKMRKTKRGYQRGGSGSKFHGKRNNDFKDGKKDDEKDDEKDGERDVGVKRWRKQPQSLRRNPGKKS